MLSLILSIFELNSFPALLVSGSCHSSFSVINLFQCFSVLAVFCQQLVNSKYLLCHSYQWYLILRTCPAGGFLVTSFQSFFFPHVFKSALINSVTIVQPSDLSTECCFHLGCVTSHPCVCLILLAFFISLQCFF